MRASGTLESNPDGVKRERRCANTARDNKSTLTLIRRIAPFAIIPQSARNVNMRKLHIKRNPGSHFIEPANPSPHTPSTPAKSTVLEILGEIACLTATFIVGWIIYVVF